MRRRRRFVDEPHDDASPAAVWPFFGQFVAHDITADRSPLGTARAARADPQLPRAEGRTSRASTARARSARRTCTRSDDPAKLLLGPGGHDVPRNHEGIALIGDPRNDVHLFLNQMQVAFIGLHNRLVDRLRDDGTAEADVFERGAARGDLALPAHDPARVPAGADRRGALRRAAGRRRPPVRPRTASRTSRSSSPTPPTVTATRRSAQRYQVNAGFGPCRVFPDLMGFGPVAPEHAVDWSLQSTCPGRPRAQRSKRIDGRLPLSLIALPTADLRRAGGRPTTRRSRTATCSAGSRSGCRRARRWRAALGVEPLEPEQVGLAEHGWTGETPLWLYVLKEAEALHDGTGSARSAAGSSARCWSAIVDADPESFRWVDPGWTPAPFGLADVPSARRVARQRDDGAQVRARAGLAVDDEGAVDRRDPVGQAAEPGAGGRPRAAHAVVADVDDELAVLAGRRGRSPGWRAATWPRSSAPPRR